MLNVMNKPIHTLLIMLCAAAVLLAAAQETTPPALPPEAQQAFDRGLKAVQQQEWDLAIRYFTDANTTAPYASTVLFNLGLAHARAGHELPAIAWLQAYLAATPQAPNAEAIRAEIERLKTVTQGKMNTIFQTTIADAQQLDPSKGDLDDSALICVVVCQAYVGDVEGAIATYKLANSQKEVSTSQCWSLFSEELISNGDLEGAQEALENVTEAKEQDEVWGDIFYAMLKSGDIEAARNAAQKIHDADKRGKLLRELRIKVLEKTVNENARKGDFDFVPVEELLPLLENDLGRIRQLVSIAEQQGKFKDAEGKSQTINRALKLARAEQKPSERASLLVDIAWNLFDQGEFSSAKAIAKEALACGVPAWWYELDEKEKANIKVIYSTDAVRAHAILGNVSEALALIRSIKPIPCEGCPRNWNLGFLAYTQAMYGDLKGARQTEAIAASILDNLEKDNLEKDCGMVQSRLADAQLKKGDPVGALETLKRSRRAAYNFDEICGKVFEHLMTEGQVSKAMEVTKLIGEVARRKEKAHQNHGGVAREYVREMGRIRITQAAERAEAGRPEAAQGTTNFVHVGKWIALAIEVSADERTGDLEKALKDAAEAKGRFAYAKTAKDRIVCLASVARYQGSTLNKIIALERKSGQERGGK